MTKRDDDRLVEVEIKLTYQERLLETLNDVILSLRAELAELRRRLEAVEATRRAPEGEGADVDEPPPHY